MKLKKYSIYLLAAAVFATGCKKELQQNDPDVISAANAFTTFEHIQLGTNGAYGMYGAYANDMYTSAIVSDESKIGINNSGQGALTYRYQYSSDPTTGGDVTAAYFPYYRMIDQINRVLSYVDVVSYTADQLPRKEIVRAQLIALRAIAHFSLLQTYCQNYNPTALGIPVMITSDASAKPARNTEAQVMAQIEADLTTAKAALPAVTPASFSDTTMNKVNIAAYQARIALYKGDYPNAVAYATEVINSNVKPISNGANFQGIWTDASTSETLFRIRYTAATIGSIWTTGANIYFAPSDKLIADYGAGDIRKATFVGGTAGAYYVNKFYTSSRGARIVDLKACRIAEMYLIRAEAYAKIPTPDLVSGAADLNTVRTNRITGYVNQSFASSADLTSAVLDERFKELCFEGFRLWDLRRNNLPVARLASDASPAWQTLPVGDYHFVFPIPQVETLANPNMVQNPGYQ